MGKAIDAGRAWWGQVWKTAERFGPATTGPDALGRETAAAILDHLRDRDQVPEVVRVTLADRHAVPSGHEYADVRHVVIRTLNEEVGHRVGVPAELQITFLPGPPGNRHTIVSWDEDVQVGPAAKVTVVLRDEGAGVPIRRTLDDATTDVYVTYDEVTPGGRDGAFLWFSRQPRTGVTEVRRHPQCADELRIEWPGTDRKPLALQQPFALAAGATMSIRSPRCNVTCVVELG